MRGWKLGGWLAAALVVISGCGDPRPSLLVVYSGDCQGYIEPCG